MLPFAVSLGPVTQVYSLVSPAPTGMRSSQLIAQSPSEGARRHGRPAAQAALQAIYLKVKVWHLFQTVLD